MDALWLFLQQYGWFIGVPLLFIVVVAYILRPSARKRYEHDGEILFEDDRSKRGPKP